MKATIPLFFWGNLWFAAWLEARWNLEMERVEMEQEPGPYPTRHEWFMLSPQRLAFQFSVDVTNGGNHG